MSRVDRLAQRLPPGRHGLSREQVEGSQRDRIHTAIIELVSQQGYVATTVADVTKRAAVSKATFYEHFDNREQCLWSANDERFEDMALAVDDGYLTGGATWKQRIRTGLSALLEHLAQEAQFTHVLLVEGLAAGRSGLIRRQLVLDALRTYFDPTMRPELASLDLDEPQRRATWTVEAVAGMMQSIVQQGDADQLGRRVDDFVWLALLAYGGEDRAVAA